MDSSHTRSEHFHYTIGGRFLPPPSTCRVVDFIGVSLYVGLMIWICMSLLNLRFLSNLICCMNFPMSTRFPTSTINVPCFGFHRCFPLLWLTYLDLYVFLRFLFSNLMFCINFPMNTRFPTSTMNVSCF